MDAQVSGMRQHRRVRHGADGGGNASPTMHRKAIDGESAVQSQAIKRRSSNSIRRAGSVSSVNSKRSSNSNSGTGGHASSHAPAGIGGMLLETNLRELEYNFGSNLDNMDFNEMHQGLLDAATPAKALIVFESMYISALETALRGNLVALLTKTPAIVELIVQQLRRFPACIRPFGLALKALAVVPEFGKMFFSLQATIALLRLFPQTSSFVEAFFALCSAQKGTLRTFVDGGGEAVLCDFASRLPVAEACAAAASAASAAQSLSVPPLSYSQSAEQHGGVLGGGGGEVLTGLAASVLMYHLVSLRPAKDAKVHADTTKALMAQLARCTEPSRLLEAGERVKAGFGQLLLGVTTTVAKDSSLVEPFAVATIFARELLTSDPALAAGFIGGLIGMEGTAERLALGSVAALFARAAANRATMLPGVNCYVLHLACRWLQGGWLDVNAVHCAVNAVARATPNDAEQEPALHVLIASLRSKASARALARLNPTAVSPSFSKYVADDAKAEVRQLWIVFVHIYTITASQNLASLFRPLREHIDHKHISEERFTAMTRWPRNDSQDVLVQAAAKRRLEQLNRIGQDEVLGRAEIEAASWKESHDFVTEARRELDVLLSDPAYVARMELRRAAIEDDCKKKGLLERALRTRQEQIESHRVHQVQRIRSSADRQKEAAEKAHKAELEGIVWDPDELALKNATFSSRISKITKQQDKQVAEVTHVTSWQLQLCEQIVLSVEAYYAARSKDLMILEKEEELIRGAGFISTDTWYEAPESISAQEAAARREILRQLGFGELHTIHRSAQEILVECTAGRLEVEWEAFAWFINAQREKYAFEVAHVLRKGLGAGGDGAAEHDGDTSSATAQGPAQTLNDSLRDIFSESFSVLDWRMMDSHASECSASHDESRSGEPPLLIVRSSSLTAITRAFESSSSSSMNRSSSPTSATATATTSAGAVAVTNEETPRAISSEPRSSSGTASGATATAAGTVPGSESPPVHKLRLRRPVAVAVESPTGDSVMLTEEVEMALSCNGNGGPTVQSQHTRAASGVADAAGEEATWRPLDVAEGDRHGASAPRSAPEQPQQEDDAAAPAASRLFSAIWPAVVEGLRGVAESERRWRNYLVETSFGSVLSHICIEEAFAWDRLLLVEHSEVQGRNEVHEAYATWAAVSTERLQTETEIIVLQIASASSPLISSPSVHFASSLGHDPVVSAGAQGEASSLSQPPPQSLTPSHEPHVFTLSIASASLGSMSGGGGHTSSVHVAYFKRFMHPVPADVQVQERLRRSKIFDRWLRWCEWLVHTHQTLIDFAPAMHVVEEERLAREELTTLRSQWINFSRQLWDDSFRFHMALFGLVELERQHRGFNECAEIIELHQILVFRPRGRRYRPIRDEEVEEKVTQDTQTQNRIKNWLRQIVPSTEMPGEAQVLGAPTADEDVTALAQLHDAVAAYGDRDAGPPSGRSGSDTGTTGDACRSRSPADTSKLAARLRAKTEEAARALLVKRLWLVERAEVARRTVLANERARVMRFLMAEFSLPIERLRASQSRCDVEHPLMLLTSGPRRSSLSFYS